MARVAGVELPAGKKLNIALRYIYGIGPAIADEIVAATGLNPDKRVNELSEEDVSKLTVYVSQNYKIEGDLRREVHDNIRRLIDISAYRGQRHRRNLPARGQRTRTNARTKRGKRKTVGAAKAAKRPVTPTAETK